MLRLVHFILVLVAALIWCSCNSMKLSQVPHLSDTDWPLGGGSIGRTNNSGSILIPPLETAWEYDGNAGFSLNGPVAEGNLFVFGNLKGELHIVNIQTGKKIAVHGFGSAIAGSPVIADSMIYLTLAKEEESVIAFDLSKGTTAWKARLGGIETSPILVGGKLYIVSLWGDLTCLDARDGKIIWTYKNPDEASDALIHSSPASDGTAIVYCRDDGAVFGVDAGSGKLIWRTKARRTIVASPSVSEGTIYVGSLDSTFYAFDLLNGSVRWKQPLDGRIFASQAVGPEYVYAGTGSGMLYCMNRTNGAIVWQYKARSVFSAAPLISGNILYAASLDQTLYAFDRMKGALLWSHKGEGRIKTTPMVHDGYLFLMLDNRTVTAFKEGGEHQ